MQKTLIVLSLLFLSAFSLAPRHSELQVLWSSWKDVHQKSYTVEEDTARFITFAENYRTIIKFNAEHTSPKLGLNTFADLTSEEYKARHLTGGLLRDTIPVSAENFTVPEDMEIPASVDWRKKKAVTPVINEGQCGACWAISVVGVLEGMRAIKNRTLTPLSAQQILDCLTTELGCSGGEFDTAFDYAGQYGIESFVDYPYAGKDQTCAYDADKAVKINSGYVNVQPNSDVALKAAIATMPTAMVIDASSQVYQLYASGVIQNGCTATAPDHTGLAVGYGTVDGVEAYYIKEVWGSNWGVHGYVYISTDPNQNNGSGVCGILTQSVIGKY